METLGDQRQVLDPEYRAVQTVAAFRAIAKHRDTDTDALKRQQELLKVVYCNAASPVSVVDTRDKSVRQVVKEVAKVIHWAEYREAPLHSWLLRFESGELHA